MTRKAKEILIVLMAVITYFIGVTTGYLLFSQPAAPQINFEYHAPDKTVTTTPVPEIQIGKFY